MKRIRVGSVVSVRFAGKGIERYKIVYPSEADALCNKISCDSPFAKAVLGREPRSKVSFQVPSAGKVCCEVLEVG